MTTYDNAPLAAHIAAVHGGELQRLLETFVVRALHLDAAGALTLGASDRLVAEFAAEQQALVQQVVDELVRGELRAAWESGLRDEAIAVAHDRGHDVERCAADYVDSVIGGMLAALRARQPNP